MQEIACWACIRFTVVAMQVHDIEDLVKVGHSMQACPYFAARHYKGAYTLQFSAYHSSLLQYIYFLAAHSKYRSASSQPDMAGGQYAVQFGSPSCLHRSELLHVLRALYVWRRER